jgi:hypothetical protein
MKKHYSIYFSFFSLILAIGAMSGCAKKDSVYSNEMPTKIDSMQKVASQRLRLLVVAENISGKNTLSIWTAFVVNGKVRPDPPVGSQYAFNHPHIYVDGNMLTVNDGSGGDIKVTKNTLPDSLPIMIVEGSDTAWLRVAVPVLGMRVPRQLTKKEMKKFIADIQQISENDEEADLSFKLPPDDIQRIQADSRLTITHSSTQVPPKPHMDYYSILNALDQYVPPSALSLGEYVMRLTLDKGTVQVLPTQSTIQDHLLPEFECVMLAETEQRVKIVR